MLGKSLVNRDKDLLLEFILKSKDKKDSSQEDSNGIKGIIDQDLSIIEIGNSQEEITEIQDINHQIQGNRQIQTASSTLSLIQSMNNSNS